MRMNRLLLSIFCLFCFSCDGNIEIENSVGDCAGLDSEAPTDATVIFDGWVCWNPDSELHGEPCTQECMKPGNQSTFCYRLDSTVL